jgi:hypothetical protein
MTTPQQHKKTGMLFREESNPAMDIHNKETTSKKLIDLQHRLLATATTVVSLTTSTHKGCIMKTYINQVVILEQFIGGGL